jgi:DNA polymerase III delta prime subunit
MHILTHLGYNVPMSLSDNFKVLSHHAYCIPGNSSVCVEIKTILENIHNIPSQANPDFYEQAHQSFIIEDARSLKALHDTRPIGHTGKKVFLISMTGITSEAQNALLKLLEEPADYAHFFIVIPSTHLLLPTVKSRLLIVGNSDIKTENEYAKDADAFRKMAVGKKLDYVKKLVDDISKEKKPKQDAIEFLNALEDSLYSDTPRTKNLQAFEAISTARKYIHDRAPSLKMLLDYVALQTNP